MLKKYMLSSTELNVCIQNTPIEHILQTRYDICDRNEIDYSVE